MYVRPGSHGCIYIDGCFCTSVFTTGISAIGSSRRAAAFPTSRFQTPGQ